MAAAAPAAAAAAAPVVRSPEAVREALLKVRFLLDGERIEAARTKLAELALPESDGDNRLLKSILCFHDKKYDEALAHATYAMELRRGHWTAYTVAAKVYIVSGYFRAARELLDKLDGPHEEDEHELMERLRHTRVCGADMRKRIDLLIGWFHEANALFQKKSYAFAASSLAKLLADCPLFEAAQALSLEILLASGKYTDVMSTTAAIHPAIRDNVDIRGCLGTAFLHTGAVEKARELFRPDADNKQSARAAQFSAQADEMDRLVVAARTALAAGHFTDAKAACESAARIAPQISVFASDAKCILSEYQLQAPEGDRRAALAMAHAAMRLNAANADAYLAASEAQSQMGHQQDAIQLLQHAKAHAPPSAAVDARLARLQLDRELQGQSHFQLLGLDGATADAEAIRRAHRAKLLEHHPDRAGQTHEANARTQRYNEAFEALIDPFQRGEYERNLSLGNAVDAWLASVAGGAPEAAVAYTEAVPMSDVPELV